MLCKYSPECCKFKFCFLELLGFFGGGGAYFQSEVGGTCGYRGLTVLNIVLLFDD